MDESIYHLYCRTKKLINDAEKNCNNHTREQKELLDNWKGSNEVIEIAYPQVKDMYERNQKIIDSFTPEQIDFICYQIGDWYMKWKNCIIVDGEKTQHRLGFAKEQLKMMICGE